MLKCIAFSKFYGTIPLIEIPNTDATKLLQNSDIAGFIIALSVGYRESIRGSYNNMYNNLTDITDAYVFI